MSSTEAAPSIYPRGHRLDEKIEEVRHRLSPEVEALIDALTAERNAWRRVTQWQTPMGSEFTTPEACDAHIRARREDEHKTKIELFRLKKGLGCKALEKLLAFLHERDHVPDHVDFFAPAGRFTYGDARALAGRPRGG